MCPICWSEIESVNRSCSFCWSTSALRCRTSTSAALVRVCSVLTRPRAVFVRSFSALTLWTLYAVAPATIASSTSAPVRPIWARRLRLCRSTADRMAAALATRSLRRASTERTRAANSDADANRRDTSTSTHAAISSRSNSSPTSRSHPTPKGFVRSPMTNW